MATALEIFESASLIGFRPPPKEPAWQWCERHIMVDKTSPMPGRWRLSSSPWVKEFMDDFQDEEVTDIVVRCSAQSSKTQTVLNLICWAIDCAPGPMMLVMAAQDEAKTFAKTRLIPTLEDCAPVAAKFPRSRHHKTTLEINFLSMPLILNGANSKSKLQSKPIRYLLLDEVRNYPPGALEMVLKRTRAFYNAKRAIISTGDKKGDAVDRAYKAGNQKEPHIPCPGCGKAPKLSFWRLKWDRNEITCPDDQWDMDEMGKTVRYECDCGHATRDVPSERKRFEATVVFIPNNPKAPKHRTSYTWSALLPHWVRWRAIVEEFLEAKKAADLGDVIPLKTFINETLGESWDEQEHQTFEIVDRPVSSYTLGDLDPKQGDFRIFTVDVQSRSYWGVVRAWNKDGSSKLLWAGEALSDGEVEELREKFGVQPKHVFIDSGFDTHQVYRRCCQFGWTSLKGEDKSYFLHLMKGGKKVRRMYSPLTRGDPGIGTGAQGKRFAPLFLWSNPWAKDVLDRLKRGAGALWETPKDVPEFYWKQLSAEIKRERKDPRTGQLTYLWVRIRRDNHLFDCEAMQVVVAAMLGIIGDPSAGDPEP